ncbi:uncharacterized protein [Drosophila kikkawai]|uniref:Uncharacterized protein n=1 Tax=Drosophila kikkawai TaxID=30033 RepID=A0A6P4JIP2_DROKI|nr:uncharacterized protein LOC108083367 [Drosophila kikkawai]
MKALLGLLLALMAMAGIRARPQNPFDSLSLGAMSLAGNIAEAVQSGAALSRNMEIDNPLMSLRSKTAVGYGDAMRQPSGSDSSDEEDRRRRRSLPSLVHRTKRAPCFWKMSSMATTAASADDDVEARRRRAARKRAANNASRSRVSPKTSGKKKLQRRRRQAESQNPLNPEAALGLGDRIKSMWLSFVDNVTDVVQQMRQKITESASATG